MKNNFEDEDNFLSSQNHLNKNFKNGKPTKK